MRREFGKTITELAEKDKQIYLIVGDIGVNIFDRFREKFPNRFINYGIREQSMISFASGMALEGLKPYIYTITPFLIERPFEQVKLGINQQNVNVKLIGYADYPTHGPTHAEIDDQLELNLLSYPAHPEQLKGYARKIEEILYDSIKSGKLKLKRNITSYFPRNAQETRQAVLESYNHQKPTFISLKKDHDLK